MTNVFMSRRLLLSLALLITGCTKPWEPTPLADGYQIMVMNSEEVYVADAKGELVVGPTIETIGVAPGLIVVNCGDEERVVNGFASTVGFNLLDTKTGDVKRRMTKVEVQAHLHTIGLEMPPMQALRSYVRN